MSQFVLLSHSAGPTSTNTQYALDGSHNGELQAPGDFAYLTGDLSKLAESQNVLIAHQSGPTSSNTQYTLDGTKTAELESTGYFADSTVFYILGPTQVTVTHTTNSVLKGTSTHAHTTNSILKAQGQRAHTTDAFLSRRYVNIHTTNAVLKGSFTRAHTTSSYLRGIPGPITHTTNSVLFGQRSVSHTTSSYLAPIAGLGDITIFVNGVNRTDWFIYPLKRSASVGSRGQLTVAITNAGKAAGVVWRPQQFDRILVFVGTYLFFNGQYIFGEESRYAGTPYYRIDGTCLTYDYRLDMIMIRQQLVLPDPIIPSITTFPVGVWIQSTILITFLSQVGIAISCNIGTYATQPEFQKTETWDTVSMLAACKGICDEFDLEMYLDQNLVLWFFNTDNSGAYGLPYGTGTAPFSVVDLTPDVGDEPAWQNLNVVKGSTSYVNRSYVRTNQTLKANLSDPIPFNLGWVPYVQDATEIARVGPVEAVQPVKNKALGQLDFIASSGLLSFEIHQATLETFHIGFEPGQRLTINTSLPLLDDILIIESVESNLVGPFTGGVPYISGSGPMRWAHTIKASNAKMHQRQAGNIVFGGIVQGINAPVDRITSTPSWEIATDIPGITNPGVLTGPHGAPLPILKDGILRMVQLSFRNPPMVSGVTFDVLLNGVSIFPASPGGITYPVATSITVTTWTFATDPLPVKGPTTTTPADELTLTCLQGDSTAMTGLIAITVQG